MRSKTQRWLLFALVSVDVLSIFADIFISLYLCEEGRDSSPSSKHELEHARHALTYVALAFSSLFMLELLATVFAFGWRHFKKWFHCLDAVVIVASFVIDTVLRGYVEEIAALVIMVRLFHFFKIIEEVEDVSEEKNEDLSEKVKDLEKQLQELTEERETWMKGREKEGEDGHESPRSDRGMQQTGSGSGSGGIKDSW